MCVLLNGSCNLSQTADLLAIDSTSGSFSPSSYEQYDEMARSIAAQVTDKDHRSSLISHYQWFHFARRELAKQARIGRGWLLE
jgi:hypothetical protein